MRSAASAAACASPDAQRARWCWRRGRIGRRWRRPRPSPNGSTSGCTTGGRNRGAIKARARSRGCILAPPTSALLVSVYDAAAVEVVGGKLHPDPVSGQDTDEELPHLP